MEQTPEYQPQVRGVMFIDSKGEQHAIPDHLSGVKMTKTGMPDKRDQRYGEFMEWVASLDISTDTKPEEPAPLQAEQADISPFIGGIDYKQDMANRIWAGQSPDLAKHERVKRIEKALADQGLSMEGVVL